jgi:5-formyltetrahydrofolate cyclo-ligase
MPQTPADDHGFIPSSADDVLRQRVKAELRKRMRGLRGALPASACAERSARICERLMATESFARARAVALFWPMARRREVDLRGLDAQLRARGVRVAYPAVDPQSHALVFRFVADPDAMIEDASQGMGLREPSALEPEALPGDLDAIVVPALVVDPSGHRIGYGAGYYDRTLPRFVPPATSIAVAFDFQLLVEVPATGGDVRVGCVVTDARSL